MRIEVRIYFAYSHRICQIYSAYSHRICKMYFRVYAPNIDEYIRSYTVRICGIYSSFYSHRIMANIFTTCVHAAYKACTAVPWLCGHVAMFLCGYVTKATVHTYVCAHNNSGRQATTNPRRRWSTADEVTVKEKTFACFVGTEDEGR